MHAPLKGDAAPGTAAPAFSAEEVAAFCDFFYRRTGIRIDASRRYFIDKRVEERIAANACRSMRDYLSLVKFQSDGSELQALINAMTVNETYFFREDYQLSCLSRRMLDEIADRKRPGDAPIRIWSVPCSTGEEPYSIALSVLEDWARCSARSIRSRARPGCSICPRWSTSSTRART